MATSQLAISNIALGLIGDSPLGSLSEVSLKSEVCARYYDSAFRMALSRGPWRFASYKATLSQLVTVPLNEWQYAYQIPTDCCRVNRVYPDGDYDIYGDQVYSNSSSLAADYVRRSTTLENITPPFFERYAAHELVPMIASSLTSDDQKVQLAEQWRKILLSEALSIDAQQQPNRRFSSSPFTDVRRQGRRV